ncbi:MAG TPA: hypothetical protein VH986_00740 [Acidimicrobiia bacterium]|jgi:hypothetical protein
MERQAGLGRSLGDVIESLTPVQPDIAERVEFDASELVERLDELLVDVRDLRDRVHRLAEIVGDDAVPADPKPKKHKKNKHGKKKGKQGET